MPEVPLFAAYITSREKEDDYFTREGNFHKGIYCGSLRKGGKIPPCPSNNVEPLPAVSEAPHSPDLLFFFNKLLFRTTFPNVFLKSNENWPSLGLFRLGCGLP